MKEICEECGGIFNNTLGFIIHRSGCGSDWPEGRPVGAGVMREPEWHENIYPRRVLRFWKWKIIFLLWPAMRPEGWRFWWPLLPRYR